MSVPPGSEYFELADYVGVLRRRWLIIVGLALIGVVLAGAYFYVAPKTYSSTVLVQVNALPTDANALGGRTGGPINMDNEGQLVKSATVASIVKAKLNSPLSIVDLVKNIEVSVPPNTTFLQISCNAGSADLATRCANAFGRAYLYNRRFSTLDLVTTGLKSLYAQASALEDSIQAMRAEIQVAPDTGKGSKGVLQLQLQAKLTRLDALSSKINSVTPLQANLAVRSTLVGTVVTPATNPLAPVSPTKKLILPSGLAGGLVLGVAFAFLWDWRRPRIHSARDVARRVDLPTVFSLVDVKNGGHATFASPRSKTGQAFTEVAQYVGTALGDGHHVLLVAGTSAGTAGSAVAANLAGALARTRGETVLICADPRGMAVPRLLGIADGRGFAEVLAGTASVSDVTRPTADLPLLRVITPGLDAAGAVYDMQHDKVQRLMRELRREVRYVIIDVPQPSADADTFSLAEFADAAIVVVQAATARPAEVSECVERLERMRTIVLAAVLLPPGRRSRRARRAAAAAQEQQAARTAPARSAAQLPAQMPATQALPPVKPLPPPLAQVPSSPRSESTRDSGWDGGRDSTSASVSQPQPSQLRQAPAHQATGDEPGGPTQPVIRPVLRRSPASTSTSTSAGSRHGTPGHASPSHGMPATSAPTPPAGSAGTAAKADKTDPISASGSQPGFGSAWTPRSVSETWPLPMPAVTDDDDEEAGVSDPLIGN